MAKTIKIAVIDDNQFLAAGIQAVFEHTLAPKQLKAILVAPERAADADYVLQYVPSGWPICFSYPRELRKQRCFAIRNSKDTTPACAGESGVIQRRMSPELLAQQLLQGLNGNPATEESPCLRCTRRQAWYLTQREREVMRFLSQEITLTNIACRMGLSIKTVSTYKYKVMNKMGFKKNSELFSWLRHQNMAHPL